MKKIRFYDEEKYKWALDSALDALSREDKKTFMTRVFDMSVASNLDQMDILYIFAQTAYSPAYYQVLFLEDISNE